MHVCGESIEVKVQIAWEPIFIVDLFDLGDIDRVWFDGAQAGLEG